MFSDPVVGNKFFGRSEPLELIAKRVDGLKDGYRQNIALLGPDLIGKTSLILHFFSHFSHPKITPIYIDLRPRSFHNFIFKFLGTLLYHYLKNKNPILLEDLALLKQHAQEALPKTVAAIQDIEQSMERLQFDQAYEKALSLTALFKEESGISCILVLDEFQWLETYKIKHPFASLAKEIMLQKDTMYLLISSAVSRAKNIFANELSLLFGNFEIIQLKPFDYSTCCKFLEKRFAEFSFPITLKDFLIGFSKRHPFYLDLISNKLLEKAKELNKTEVSPRLISEAFNSLLYDSRGILNQYFTTLLSHNLNGADYSNFMPILLSASVKGCRMGEISKTANRPPQIITRQINYLLEKDLLTKFGVFYRIQDEIFRFWLKSVYQRKAQSLICDPLTEAKDFSQEIENQILTFSQEANKKLIERIVDLFKSFQNELIMVQNKFFKFWHFEEVKPWLKANLPDSILARYKDKYWACLIKKEPISETLVQEFYHCCKSSKYKITKAIIISFSELELNAKLFALEKKMWIWSPADVNLLLDLYGKQQLIN